MNRRIAAFRVDTYPTGVGEYGNLDIPAGLSSELDYWTVVSHAVTPTPDGGFLVTCYCEPKTA